MGRVIRKSAQDLLIDMMDRLGAQYDPYQSISGILADTCRFFGFGCGFIYEADHTGNFYLQEQYCSYTTEALRDELDFREFLNPKLMESLARTNVVFFPTRSGIGELDAKLADLFEANSLMTVPIAGTDNAPIGIVGMSDRRGRILLSTEEINVARSILAVLSNHVKLRMYQKKVENSQKALESMLDNMGIDIYVNDFNTHEILYLNKSMAEPYGERDKIIGRRCWEALYTDKTGQCDYCPQKKLIDENGEPTNVYHWDYQRPFDGSWFRVFSAAFQWTDGRLAHVVSSVDITESKNNEALIRQMAEYDSLTGLPNRRKLIIDLREAVNRMEETGQEGFVLFFDLDNFKRVNDTLGHRAGDELLANIGKHLESAQLTRGKGYRHSGDEFVVICENMERAQVEEICGFILESFFRPWQLMDGIISCPTSIGVAHYPEDAATAEELIHKADIAMYHAKHKGKNNAHFYCGADMREDGEHGHPPN